jgi:hypothetical protein
VKSIPTKPTTLKSTASPTKKQTWPTIKVPYQTKALDTCDALVTCERDLGGDGIAARGLDGAQRFGITLAPVPTALPQIDHFLEKREVRTFKPDISGSPAFEIESLDYPSGSKLYTGPKGNVLDVHVFDFKTDNVVDVTVSDSPKAPTGNAGSKWVTEHIVEVSSELLRFWIKLIIPATNRYDVH